MIVQKYLQMNVLGYF